MKTTCASQTLTPRRDRPRHPHPAEHRVDPDLRPARHDPQRALHALGREQGPDAVARRPGHGQGLLHGGPPGPLQQPPPRAARPAERVQGVLARESPVRVHRPVRRERRSRRRSSRGSPPSRCRWSRRTSSRSSGGTWGWSSCMRTRRKSSPSSRTRTAGVRDQQHDQAADHHDAEEDRIPHRTGRAGA